MDASHLIADLLPHMRKVLSAERDLHDLNLLWQLIGSSSAISCPGESASILPTLTETRARFAELQDRLVRQLATENLAELGDELASVAQCTIDILVRNLFERTADVGFLATDDPLCAFCAMNEDERAGALAALRQRLTEYRAKYTVYDDVIVLDTEGRVLARLEAGGVAVTTDSIVAEALRGPGYVERYAPTDLSRDGSAALLYAHRIVDAQRGNVGVLVLRFRMEDELERIFASVTAGREGVAVALIDPRGRVILSNDVGHVPLGALLNAGPPEEVGVTIFAGREYLSITCETRGYQGYRGPGWRAHAMVSLLTAFRGGHAANADEGHEVTLDNAELQAIQSDVDAINRNLRRVVWNGRLKAGSDTAADGESHDRLKAVLHEINQASARTRDRVAIAIGDLYRTSLGRARHQARELARLAADIMDRNLYERANDCRWWALSPVVQSVLASAPSPDGTRELNRVLRAINDLYTVYARLVVFDREGVIQGVSHDTADHSLIGTQVDAAYLQAVVGLSDSQRYAVSPFAPTRLYDGAPSYVYLAAVRDGANHCTGGIAIVFHAEREFRAMLTDVLGGRNGWAAFVDADGRVVSSTDDALPPGSSLPSECRAGIVTHAGVNYVMDVQRAGGYREFKNEDGYANDISVVVALRLGAAERRHASATELTVVALPTSRPALRREFALFQVSAGYFALPAHQVVECCEPRGLMRMTGVPRAVLGMLPLPASAGGKVAPVLCARRVLGLEGEGRSGDGLVVIVASPGLAPFGLLVDQVLSVAEVGPEHVQPVTSGLRNGAPALAGLLRLSSGATGDVLVQQLDAEVLRSACGLAGLAKSPPSLGVAAAETHQA